MYDSTTFLCKDRNHHLSSWPSSIATRHHDIVHLVDCVSTSHLDVCGITPLQRLQYNTIATRAFCCDCMESHISHSISYSYHKRVNKSFFIGKFFAFEHSPR